MLRRLFPWVRSHERHLSAVAMLAGFISDNLLFKRVDLLQTQLLFAAYTVVCFVAIPLLHWSEARAVRGKSASRQHLLLPFVIQFALGGFWSGFVIFYGRSADFGTSWPFILFLFSILLASEYFHRYHARLVFTSVLFFFALYSYAIFAVPMYTGTIGPMTFLLSGAVAIGIFALFTMVLRLVARERFMADIWRVRAGALGVLLVMNLFYFVNILPPLPLSATGAGVYHTVWRVPGAYLATTEGESWPVRYLGLAPTLQVVPGESLSAYSSVFAPTALTTTIVHEWQWYDPVAKQWIEKAKITYPIAGGRDGGYRGYSTVPVTDMGQWRVNIETIDGRLITQLPFIAQPALVAPVETIVTLP